MNTRISTNNYLVVTPDNFFLCNDVRHIISTIKHSCYRLNGHQLQNFNKLITRHIERADWDKPIKKQKYIIKDNIYVIKLDKDEIRLFY